MHEVRGAWRVTQSTGTFCPGPVGERESSPGRSRARAAVPQASFESARTKGAARVEVTLVVRGREVEEQEGVVEVGHGVDVLPYPLVALEPEVARGVIVPKQVAAGQDVRGIEAITPDAGPGQVGVGPVFVVAPVDVGVRDPAEDARLRLHGRVGEGKVVAEIGRVLGHCAQHHQHPQEPPAWAGRHRGQAGGGDDVAEGDAHQDEAGADLGVERREK